MVLYKMSMHVLSQSYCHTVASRTLGHKTDVNNSYECIGHVFWLKTQDLDDVTDTFARVVYIGLMPKGSAGDRMAMALAQNMHRHTRNSSVQL